MVYNSQVPEAITTMTTFTAPAPATTSIPMGEWFTSLNPELQAEITSMVNEEGYPLSDIEEFIADYGSEAFASGAYHHWCELSEEKGISEGAVEAFIDEFGIANIEQFIDKYVGEYASEVAFAEDYFIQQWGYEDVCRAIERGVVVDWQAT